MLTLKQVAEILGVSVPTVWRRVDSGKLRAYRDEGIVRVDAVDLAEYIRSKSSGGVATAPSSSRGVKLAPARASIIDEEERGLALARKFGTDTRGGGR